MSKKSWVNVLLTIPLQVDIIWVLFTCGGSMAKVKKGGKGKGKGGKGC